MEYNKTLVVKDASINEFEKGIIGESITTYYDVQRGVVMGSKPSSGSIFGKEFYYRKDLLSNFEYVLLEIKDKAEKSGIELISTFTYKVEPYDDISVKLVLDKSDSRRA